MRFKALRALRWTATVVVTLVALTFAALWQQKYARHADASPLAIAAATPDDEVKVEFGEYLTFRPLRGPERLGVIFYPGAFTDIRGYAPTLRSVAAAGYRVIAVPMPFELAILSTDRAAGVLAANADMKHWAIIGHSVGGTAAAIFANAHRDALDGVIIWDSFPPTFASLADWQKPVWQIHRAKLDGAPPETFARQRHLFPPGSRWVPIPGGIHMNFGAFSGGGYKEDWAPEIDQSAQHKLVVAATLEALAEIERAGKPTPAP
ncbi:MAG: alpha/beta hydrolase [Rhodospirillaceae bacterium]|nr:alpha/beta hydrolase [Rhodospirillaceae bacterium]